MIAKGRSLSWKPDRLRFTGLVYTQNSHRIVLQSFTIHWVVGIPAIYLAAQQMWSPVRGNPGQAAKPVKPVRQSPSESFLSVAGRRATDQHFEGEVFSFQQSKANENIVCSWDCGDQRRNRHAFADPAFPGWFDTGSKNQKTGRKNNTNEVA